MTKKELLNSPYRQNINQHYQEIYIIPNGLKHESGFMYITIIGAIADKNPETTLDNNIKYEICGQCDDLSTFFPMTKLSNNEEFPTVRIDCLYPQGILRYHGTSSPTSYFTVSDNLSSMDITYNINN